MSDLFSVPIPEEIEHTGNPELDAIAVQISDLSKEGYQLIKDNKNEEAEEAFRKILDLDENNNYALVGLGDSARKQNKFNDKLNELKEILNDEIYDIIYKKMKED